MKPIIFALCLLSLANFTILLAGDWGPWTDEHQASYDRLVEGMKRAELREAREQARHVATMCGVVGATGLGVGGKLIFNAWQPNPLNIPRGKMGAGIALMSVGAAFLVNAVKKSRES